MATTTLKGIVKSIEPIENYGESGRRQTLVLFIPGFVNNYGEKTGRDETWGIDIYNKKIDELALSSNSLERKAEIDIYLSGTSFDKKDGTGKFYSISATLKSIKLGEVIQGDAVPF